MKKLFLTICFSLILWQTGDSAAKTMSFQDMEAAQAYKQSQPALPLQPIKDNSPDPRDTKAMEKYIIDRLKNATFSTLDNMNKPSSMNMQHSDEYIAQMKEKTNHSLRKFMIMPSTAFRQGKPSRAAMPATAARSILS